VFEIHGLIIFLLVSFLLFLILRALVLWYWRVNVAIGLLKSIDDRLARMASVNNAPTVAPPYDV
jgi:hypothetical protein